MANLNPVILPAKALKGGRHKVRVSVSHNGEFRYLLTDIIIDSAKEFKNGQIVKRPDAAILNTKLRGILQKYQRAIDNLEYVEGLTCPELVYQIKNADKYAHRTLVSVFNEYMGWADVKQTTRALYESSFRCVVNCLGDKLLVENITHSTVLSFMKYMREDLKLKPATIRSRLAVLATIVIFAKKCGYAKFRSDPFLGVTKPKPDIRDSWLTVEQVRAIRDYDAPTKTQAMARDFFMLSYYLGGINMVDLQSINFLENTERLKYERTKTNRMQKSNRYVEFDIPPEAKEIISRRIGPDGRLALTEHQRKSACNSLFCVQLANIAKALEIPNLIFYSARKSFSQHAFTLGVGTSTIDYILGHSLGNRGSCLFNYIKVTPELATEAVKKVLDNLR